MASAEGNFDITLSGLAPEVLREPALNCRYSGFGFLTAGALLNGGPAVRRRRGFASVATLFSELLCIVAVRFDIRVPHREHRAGNRFMPVHPRVQDLPARLQ